MTEQFRLVANAQESKILRSNATTIKIKCSNNFPRGIVSKLSTQAWNKAKKNAHQLGVRAKRVAKPRGILQIELYTHPSRGSATKTIQNSHPSPASCAGYGKVRFFVGGGEGWGLRGEDHQ